LVESCCAIAILLPNKLTNASANSVVLGTGCAEGESCQRRLFLEAFEGHQQQLVNHEIDIRYSGLLIALLSRKVLSHQQVDECRSQVCQPSILLWKIFNCKLIWNWI